MGGSQSLVSPSASLNRTTTATTSFSSSHRMEEQSASGSRTPDVPCAPRPHHHQRMGHKSKNATNNLPPILFHSIHGENVRINSDRSAAARVNSYCKAIVFSNRPIKEKERVFIKFSDISSNWSGALRFGFTTINPSSFRTNSNLPKYVCPDMTNQEPETSWAKALPERLASPDAILSFHFTTSGRCSLVHFAINGEEKGTFPIGIKDKSENVWALIDIYGNTTSIELVDPRISIHNNLQSRGQNQSLSRRSRSLGVIGLPTPEDSDDDDGIGMYESLHTLSVVQHNEKREPQPQVYSKASLSPLNFHRVRGCNVRLSNDRTIAERDDSHYSQGYCFSQKPLQINEKIVLQVLKTAELYSGSLTFGLTTCDPCDLIPNDLPEDSHQLLDRPEYWIVVKDVANGPQAGDEIAFEITSSGKVLMTKNRQAPVTLMHVDATQSFYAFLDLYGSTMKVRLLGTLKAAPRVRSGCCSVPRTSQPCNSGASTEELYGQTGLYAPLNVNVNLYRQPTHHKESAAPISRCPDYAVPVKRPTNSHHSPCYSTVSRGSSALSSQTGDGASIGTTRNECIVCFESPINTVLYMCGHMCMCYECAVKQWKAPGGGQCPICRANIRDVIRTYRS